MTRKNAIWWNGLLRKSLCLMLPALAALTVPPSAIGYIRIFFADASGSVPEVRPDNAGVQFYINSQIAAGLVSNATGAPVTVISANSDPVRAAQAAITSWTQAVAGIANLKFLPLKPTDATPSSGMPDYLSEIVFATADDLSVMGYSPGKSSGAVAVTVPFVAAQPGRLPNGMIVKRGDLVDTDILLNSSLTFSTDGSTAYDLQSIITHELGHALGINHTGLLGATMFQYSSINNVAQVNQRYLGSDEASFAAAAYPLSGSSLLGSISGKVVASDGTPVKYGLLTLIDPAGGNSMGAITGSDGSYSIQVTPGSYLVLAEPMSASSIVEAANIIANSGSLDPTQVTSNFQPTLLGGPNNPTAVNVTAGNGSTAPDLTVTAGPGSLTMPFLGFGQAGGAGDITNVLSINGSHTLPSGQSMDIAFLAGGFDGSENVQVFGQGIALRPGSLHIDKSINFGAGPLVRGTLDIAAIQNTTLASIFVSKGASSLSMSGVFVIVPPKPAFLARGVDSAASPQWLGAVSPGGISAIYDIPNAPDLGPLTPVSNSGYDAYGELPASLSGVTVTFDGVSAPLFFVYGGQINLQVPFEVAGKTSTQVVVTYRGSASDPVSVPVVAAQPSFFTYTPGGSDSIAGNQDYTPNTAQNPASRGSVVTIYGTGIGQVSYSVPTGYGAPAPAAGYTGGNTCILGGTKAVNVAFTGWTPAAVGLAQWSFVLPADSPTGAVPVKCADTNGNNTPPGTIYVN